MSQITNDRLNPVWHRMPYSCTRMATLGVKGLKPNWSRPTYVVYRSLSHHDTLPVVLSAGICDDSVRQTRIAHRSSSSNRYHIRPTVVYIYIRLARRRRIYGTTGHCGSAVLASWRQWNYEYAHLTEYCSAEVTGNNQTCNEKVLIRGPLLPAHLCDGMTRIETFITTRPTYLKIDCACGRVIW